MSPRLSIKLYMSSILSLFKNLLLILSPERGILKTKWQASGLVSSGSGLRHSDFLLALAFFSSIILYYSNYWDFFNSYSSYCFFLYNSCYSIIYLSILCASSSSCLYLSLSSLSLSNLSYWATSNPSSVWIPGGGINPA